MAKYRKKPVVIDAEQFLPGIGLRPEGVEPTGYKLHCFLCGGDETQHGVIRTLEGTMQACSGDWIITGVAGERYPCKRDIFALTYEPVEESAAP